MSEPILLLIAHGSRSSRWCNEIRAFTAHVREAQESPPLFEAVSCCFLEDAHPSIAGAVEELCQTGAREIVALPLFLSVSEHVLQDIPQAMESVSQFVEKRDGCSVYRRNQCTIRLLDPPGISGLLAENVAWRFRRQRGEADRPGILLVFYGSKKYRSSWDRFGEETREALARELPGVAVEWAYGGDAVDFSPRPIAERIQSLAGRCDQVMVLPALVSVGVIQTDVIPQAIRESGLQDRVVYARDAVLPDPDLAQKVLSYANQFLIENGGSRYSV